MLYLQDLDLALEEKKPDDIDEKEWRKINRLVCFMIRSCLSKE